MTKLSLFKVVDTKVGDTIKDGYPNKSSAKKYRKTLNPKDENGVETSFRFVVARSHDHWKGPTKIKKG
jgi:hypothetical protein